ncbi:MAG: hypothetical protein N2259_02705 [Patescibacteria group bacterium]|nr:hypothetical protein [Patescibacteria group bacterium]
MNINVEQKENVDEKAIQNEIEVTNKQIEKLNKELAIAEEQGNRELAQTIREVIHNFTKKLESLQKGIIPEPEE